MNSDNNTKNLKCLVFMKKDEFLFKILKFKTRDVALQYYKIANHKPNFKFVGLLNECIEWCVKNKYKYIIIEREEYNIYE